MNCAPSPSSASRPTSIRAGSGSSTACPPGRPASCCVVTSPHRPRRFNNLPTNDIRTADELAAPLDLLLTSSAVGVAERMMPNVSWSRFAIALARKPRTLAHRASELGGQLVAIAEGRSDLAPAKVDKRFADPAWQGNPLLKATMQAYLATNETVDALFSDAELDWRDGERIRFVLDVLTEGLAPSNNPLLNPLAYKA